MFVEGEIRGYERDHRKDDQECHAQSGGTPFLASVGDGCHLILLLELLKMEAMEW